MREQIIIHESMFVEPVNVQIAPKKRGQPVLSGKPVAKMLKSHKSV